ncbi:oligosaccharide flippase family protein [Haloferax denitrificans]|nr:polysaccharide biosynthesis C-terminal domain-containing protein [Haloferax denitrificans]
MSSKTSLFSRILSILSANVGKMIVGILMTPILVRYLGSEGYGELSFLLSIYSYLILFSGSGLAASVQKHIPEARDIKNWKEMLVKYHLLTSLKIISTFVIFILLVTSVDLTPLFEIKASSLLWLLIGYVAIESLFLVTRSSVMAVGAEKVSEPIYVFRYILYFVLCIVFLSRGLGVAAPLLAHMLSILISLTLLFVKFDRYIPVRRILFSDTKGLPTGELVSFSSSSIFLSFAMISLYNTDLIILKIVENSTTVGYYKSALVIVEFLWFIPIAIQTAYLHSTSQLWSENKTKDLERIASTTTRTVLSLSLVMAVGIMSLSDQFIGLYYGLEFLNAKTALLILLPGAIGFAVARPLYAICLAGNQTRHLRYFIGGCALLNGVLNIILIPQYGMAGAAVATSATYGLMFVLMTMSLRLNGVEVKNLMLESQIVAIFITTVVIYGFKSILSSNIAQLIIIPPVGFVIHTTMCHRLGILDVKSIYKKVT